MSATQTVGIRSFGAYIPRLRLQRSAIAAALGWAFPGLRGIARGERSMCGWDEDVITMAVEAGRDCLRGVAAGTIGKLTVASTTAPYADLSNAVFVSAALQLSSRAAVAESAGSTRAGLTALIAACRSTSAGAALVIASEKRSAVPGSAQEMHIGCGAGAVAVGPGDSVLARFLDAESLSVPFIDHFRRAGSDSDYVWEERWVRDEGVAKLVPEAIRQLLGRLKRDVKDIAHFGLAGGPPKSDQAVARILGIESAAILTDLSTTVGDTGTAQPMLQLIAALERAQPGELIVIASFAQGCEVVAFEMGTLPPGVVRRGLSGSIADRIEETAYLKLLANDERVALEWGMRSEADNKSALTQLYRAADQVFGFVGGKCGACGAVQFPRMPACVNCGEASQLEPYSLVDEPAKVATYTADWLQYSPAPPLYMGLVQFDCGARVLMEMVDVGQQGIDVDTTLTMTFRKKERDKIRGWDRYFWKATPTR